MTNAGERAARCVDDAVLSARGMPQPEAHADKEGRGTVLVVAGSREVPGAAVLAAVAALRAGAGRLCIAAPASVALALGVAVPEARVVSLPEGASGGPSTDGVEVLRPLADRIDALVIGPGLMDEDATARFTQALLQVFPAPAVLDAGALGALQQGDGMPPRGNLLITPHAGEMAKLTGLPKDEVLQNMRRVARDVATRHGLGAVLKGAQTWFAFPGEDDWHHDGGDVGLATSGSGDTLAGIIGGLLARGLPPLDAALWGVRLHASAGERLARRHGRLGFLASELAAEVPAAMHALCAAGRSVQRDGASLS